MQKNDFQNPEILVKKIQEFLDSKKAEDIVIIDLREKTSLTDFMIIASGNSSRQVSAMAQGLYEELKKNLNYSIAVEGLTAADWVLLDVGSVIVHLFKPEVRAFYNLEDMWTIEPEALLKARPVTT